MDDLHHPLDLLGGDGPRAGLLAQQVHHVRRELIAGLGKGVPIRTLKDFKMFTKILPAHIYRAPGGRCCESGQA